MRVTALWKATALLALVATVAAAGTPAAPAAPAPPAIVVYKSPTCGCCGKWIEHLRSAGFAVTPKDVDDGELDRLKGELGVPAPLRTCHTAVIGKYVVEGHVPAEDLKRFLAAKPAAAGIAVPGMPAGSPGMEAGGRKDAYEVVTFDAKGRTTTFAKH